MLFLNQPYAALCDAFICIAQMRHVRPQTCALYVYVFSINFYQIYIQIDKVITLWLKSILVDFIASNFIDVSNLDDTHGNLRKTSKIIKSRIDSKFLTKKKPQKMIVIDRLFVLTVIGISCWFIRRSY